MPPLPATGPVQLTLGIIKPSVCSSQAQVKEVLQLIKQSGLEIVRQKRMFWKTQDAEKVQHATSSPCLTLALYGPLAIQTWRYLIGPTHVYKAQWLQGHSLRARFGTSDTRNGFHGSDSELNARKELEQVFEGWDIAWWLKHKEEIEGKTKS
ncbi:BQ2448_7496 [Microbotryum intermedium]|uniref:Nucleoside diphosphate kinase n=1 Tax=Microbotryum intermedium TaxID=269621 RepID=A0A238FIF9_9BASI|nr:BQ2448_7496 [Microbotryum intermedium]